VRKEEAKNKEINGQARFWSLKLKKGQVVLQWWVERVVAKKAKK
jgi:hypothetical protein